MYFPHPLLADDDGILAIGGDLNPDRLLLAYRFGIFPWYQDEPIMWWFTHPRCILYPEKVKVSKSMRPYFNQNKFEVTYDTSFEEVMYSCADITRKDQDSTWINDEMIDAYCKLHEKGYAHSVEVWQEGKLVGGLYGVSVGKIFCGESMFAKVSNASKYALISLCRLLEVKGYDVIDCQQETGHLMSLGAQLVSKESFYNTIKWNLLECDNKEKWKEFKG